MSGKERGTDDPDRGHTFRLSVTSRMSSKVVGDEHHTDADWFSPPIVAEVRAWDLPAALRFAAGFGLTDWEHIEAPEDLPRSVAVGLEQQVAAAATLHTPEVGSLLCPTCIAPFPCPTAKALGVTLLDDDLAPL